LHPAGRIALVLMDGRLQKSVFEVAGWQYAVLSVARWSSWRQSPEATMRI
jgi:hypothetical protein